MLAVVPERVSVPEPVLVKAKVPAVFLITPLNELVALLLPTVNIGVPPATVSTVPAPLRPFIVSLEYYSNRVCPLHSHYLPDPSGILFAAPSLSMPAAMVLSPL